MWEDGQSIAAVEPCMQRPWGRRERGILGGAEDKPVRLQIATVCSGMDQVRWETQAGTDDRGSCFSQ